MEVFNSQKQVLLLIAESKNECSLEERVGDLRAILRVSSRLRRLVQVGCPSSFWGLGEMQMQGIYTDLLRTNDVKLVTDGHASRYFWVHRASTTGATTPSKKGLGTKQAQQKRALTEVEQRCARSILSSQVRYLDQARQAPGCASMPVSYLGDDIIPILFEVPPYTSSP